MKRREFLQLGALASLPVWAQASPGSLDAARQLRTEDFRRLRWQDAAGGQPVLQPAWPSPIIADPAVVPPHDSPDGRWHLWAHSALGIHHSTSSDGLTWSALGPAPDIWNGMRCCVVRDGSTWWMLYEHYPSLGLARTALPAALRKPWRSWLSARRSADLLTWSEPQTLMEPHAPWHASPYGQALGNPCAVPRPGGGWTLYFSAGLVFIEDCGFTEPYAIGTAQATQIAGPWTSDPQPLLLPDPAQPHASLSAGSLKVLPCRDGFVGFQNCIGLRAGKSTSAIYLLWSSDGRRWQRESTPLLAPGNGDWRSSHVYACCVEFDAVSGQWWMFYNARNGWSISEGREAIGALTALPPV